jgi:hypothetical protein
MAHSILRLGPHEATALLSLVGCLFLLQFVGGWWRNSGETKYNEMSVARRTHLRAQSGQGRQPAFGAWMSSGVRRRAPVFFDQDVASDARSS